MLLSHAQHIFICAQVCKSGSGLASHQSGVTLGPLTAAESQTFSAVVGGLSTSVLSRLRSVMIPGWLNAHNLKGLLTEGVFSFSNAATTLWDTWFSEVCQSSSKVQSYLDNMHFDSGKTAPDLHSRPSPAFFALIKFGLGSHWLKVETDRWLPSRPPRDERIWQHCHMQAVEDEQHFLFDCPLYTAIREQHSFCLAMIMVAFASFWSIMLTPCLVLPATFTCAFMPGCLMSHIWLHTTDCKLR